MSADRPVALVTGANRGIGLQTATQLAGQGYHVLIGARKLEAGEAAAAAIRSDGQEATAIQLDVSDRGSIEAAAARVGNEFGQLDVLSTTLHCFWISASNPRKSRKKICAPLSR